MQTISVSELKSRLDNGEKINLLDVREPAEHIEFNIGGTPIPLGKIKTMQTDEIDNWKNDEVIVYCRSGNRSSMASLFLEQMGFQNVKNLTGGMLAWKEMK